MARGELGGVELGAQVLQPLLQLEQVALEFQFDFHFVQETLDIDEVLYVRFAVHAERLRLLRVHFRLLN